jgi:hypothetical protein
MDDCHLVSVRDVLQIAPQALQSTSKANNKEMVCHCKFMLHELTRI